MDRVGIAAVGGLEGCQVRVARLVCGGVGLVERRHLLDRPAHPFAQKRDVIAGQRERGLGGLRCRAAPRNEHPELPFQQIVEDVDRAPRVGVPDERHVAREDQVAGEERAARAFSPGPSGSSPSISGASIGRSVTLLYTLPALNGRASECP